MKLLPSSPRHGGVRRGHAVARRGSSRTDLGLQLRRSYAALRHGLLFPNPRGAVDPENLNDPEDMQPEGDNHCNAGHYEYLGGIN